MLFFTNSSRSLKSKFLKNKELEDLEQNIKSNKLNLDSQNSKILSDKERLFKIDSEIKTINSENELIKQGLESLKNFKSEAVQELDDILIEKEKKQKLLNSTNLNYNKIRLATFLIGFFAIIFSETTIRFISNVDIQNIGIIISPILIFLLIYFYLFYKFNFQISKK